MDDYNIVSLQESNNEWVSRLINLLSPCVVQGIRDMLSESLKICVENDEEEKYLMTFQNILSRVPKWNTETLLKEVDRIKEMSKCEYLEDLISCVHIVQLKALTCIRVGQKQKTIDIDIPKFDNFVHKVYTHLARKLFSNVYLFEANLTPLTIQKNNREIELIAKDCILEAVRESIPVEAILRAYLDKTVEENVEQEIVHENVEVEEPQNSTEIKNENTTNMPANINKNTHVKTSELPLDVVETISLTSSPSVKPIETTPDNSAFVASSSVLAEPLKTQTQTQTQVLKDVTSVLPFPPPTYSQPTTSFSAPMQSITFSNIDEVQNAETRTISTEEAPKDVESLEKRAEENYQKQLVMEEEEEDDDDDGRIKIHRDENIVLDIETL